MQYSPTVHVGQTVQTLERDEALGAYKITTNTGVHWTRTIVICAGAGAFQAKKLPLAEAVAWEGRGVYYFVHSKAAFAGKRLLIIGGGDSAIDWSLNLQDTCSHITLIHRRNQFRAHEDSVQQLLKTSAQVLTFHELKALVSEGERLTGAVIYHNQTMAERTLAVDAILVQVGFVSSLGPLRHWPVKLQGGGILVDAHMQTNLPGVFAAGDVVAFDGKLKLIATGFGEAAIAVNYAKTVLDPKAKAFPGHSSEMTPQQHAVTTV